MLCVYEIVVWVSPVLRLVHFAAACSCGILLDRKKIKIESPGYSSRDDYPNNSKCVWVIQAPEGKVCISPKEVIFTVIILSLLPVLPVQL